MRKMLPVLVAALCFFCVSAPRLSLSEDTPVNKEEPTADRKEATDTEFSFEEAYQRYFKTPGELSKESYDWVRKDIENIGAWEYRIETFTLSDSVTADLNDLGQQRWELIWIQPQGEKFIGVFKRTKRSYLKSLPAKDLMKLLKGDS